MTGGAHCAIGGSENDFLVTSTLASQAPPAVGRALGLGLAGYLGSKRFDKGAVSVVSVGDGSVNNAHFMSAVNLAEYASFRNVKCPVLFVVTDNGLCISLKTGGWTSRYARQRLGGVERFGCDGRDLFSVRETARRALAYVRETSKPGLVLYERVPRRFGHAAPDFGRQFTYRSPAEIQASIEDDPVAYACWEAIAAGSATGPELADLFDDVGARTEAAFDRALTEPKLEAVGRQGLVSRNSAPLWPVPAFVAPEQQQKKQAAPAAPAGQPPRDVMRKHMTRVLEEVLAANPLAVYIGEDVEHGGYYLVSEGLKKKFPVRVADFPPDETALVGVAMGYSQSGLTPICEIPYAKYLDCAFDMYEEAAFMNFFSVGKQRNGMLVRLQGFGRGVFGGNFHTHNVIHIPPGVDCVCFSNGRDYARGIRHAFRQAQAGRVVMSVDSTHLLNHRHVLGADYAWETEYPDERATEDPFLPFEEVRVYRQGVRAGGDFGVRGPADAARAADPARRLAIVTYGDGVVSALQARAALPDGAGSSIDVIDVPYLSSVPAGLDALLRNYSSLVIADICKEGTGPVEAFIPRLRASGALPSNWISVAAARTYNPLGSAITFTGQQDIEDAVAKIMKQ